MSKILGPPSLASRSGFLEVESGVWRVELEALDHRIPPEEQPIG